MLIDCDTCAVRDVHCGDCIMTVLLRQPSLEERADVYEVDDDEARALAALADGGLVPRLRLVPLDPGVCTPAAHAERPPGKPSLTA